MFPDLAGWMFLVEALFQMEEHVADIEPFHPPCEESNIFLAGWSCIQHLSLGLALEAFGEQFQDMTCVVSCSLCGVYIPPLLIRTDSQ